MSKVIDIDKLVEPIALLYADLDTQLFLNIISRMKIDVEDAGSEAWLRNKINQAPAVSRANGKIINKYNKLIVPEMQKVIRSINTTGESTQSITAILNSFRKYSNNMLSFTSSQALESSNSEYLRISNNAFLEVSTGLRTFEQSITRATKELADKGINVLSYSSGKTINIRSGVAREITTQTAINARDIQDAYADDFGLTLFEVSSHAGARAGCYPYQGKIYDESGKSGTVEDIDGRKFKYDSSGRTSIGEPAGLFGINCTHMKYYIEDGAFSKTFDLYKKEENDIIYEYDQSVRRMENSIEKEKRRLEGFEQSNNIDEAKTSRERLKEKRKKLREYKKENLPKMEKLAKEGLIDIPEPKPKAKPKPKKKVEPKPKEKSIKDKMKEKYDDKYFGNEDIRSAFFEVVDDAPEEMLEFTYKYLEKGVEKFQPTRKSVSHYLALNKSVNFDKDDMKALSDKTSKLYARSRNTVVHEIGHGLDKGIVADKEGVYTWQLYSELEGELNNKVQESIDKFDKKYKAYKKKTTRIKNPKTLERIEKEREEAKKYIFELQGRVRGDLIASKTEYIDGKYKNIGNKKYAGLSDIVGAITKNKMHGGFTHDLSYWKDKGNQEAEIFADLYELNMNNNTEALEVIDKYFDGLNKVFLKVIKESIKND